MNTLEYKPLERIKIGRPVNRIDMLKKISQGKYCLDVGALDETAYFLKENSEFWLHKQLASVAKKVIGVDLSNLIPQEDGIKTSENAIIYNFNIYNLGKTDKITNGVDISDFDIIVAGEVIEHLENPLEFLKLFTQKTELKGKTLVISTPNAQSFHNGLIGLFGMESTHEDHLAIFSYKTLNTLCIRASAKDWNIVPTYSSFSEMKLSSKGFFKIIVHFFEYFVNLVEFIFPIRSGGYVVIINL